MLAEGDYASKEYVNKADGIIEAALKALETGKVDQLVGAVKEAQDAAAAAKATADKAIEEAGNAGAALERLRLLLQLHRRLRMHLLNSRTLSAEATLRPQQ